MGDINTKSVVMLLNIQWLKVSSSQALLMNLYFLRPEPSTRVHKFIKVGCCNVALSGIQVNNTHLPT